MEVRRRRHHRLYGFHPVGVRHRAGDGDRARPLRPRLLPITASERAALEDMRRRWPQGEHTSRTRARTAPLCARIFDKKLWRADRPLRVVLIGTDFEVRVWETLLRIPMGRATTYSDIADNIGRPKASRAVGAAVGKNPISFVVPCHRVIGKSGELTGYHWGLTRKRAMLGLGGGNRCAALARFAPAIAPSPDQSLSNRR